MTEHRETRIVPYTADFLYAVVADIERYPEFLPWVTGLHILGSEQVKGRTVLTAEMEVGFRALCERYTSRVTLDPGERRIDAVQKSGPFRRLENHWRFTPVVLREEGQGLGQGPGCRLEFSIAFEFRNRLLGAVAGAAFGRVLFKMADAFEARAAMLSQQPL